MLPDITIDTNVLMHAEDPRQARRVASRTLIERMLEAETLLCVDEGFNLSPALNHSHIADEYIANLRFGSAGFAMVAALASQGRIRQRPRATPQPIARAIRRLVSNPRDRTFLGVAYNSESRLLASHDFQHFSKPIRKIIASQFAVAVNEARDCLAHFT